VNGGADSRPWVLVVGGSHAEIPLIEAAKGLGFRVATSGNRPGDLGHARGDRYVAADYSEVDQVLAAARSVDAVGIVSGCNDFAAISTAAVAERLGLPGHDDVQTSLQVHHKDRFRQLLLDLGLPSPRAVVVRTREEARKGGETLGFPVIVKPVDLTGGKGISVCRDEQELVSAADRAFVMTRQQHIVVEEYVEGTKHGFTCFVVQGAIRFWFADDEQYYDNPFLVGGTTTPSTMSPSSIEKLVAAVETIAHGLDLVDGLVHVQCIESADGPFVIELCRRCPGDLYPEFVRHATGYPYASAVVASELGLPIPEVEPSASRCIGRTCVMAQREGTVQSVGLDRAMEARLIDSLTWWRKGDRIENHLVDKLGILFFAYAERDEMARLTAELSTLLTVAVA
jgi:glutathione synthase/RimK-type ligase-like ATP-grasp enzyme